MAEDKLDNVRQTKKQFTDSYGPPREGFEEFLNQCQQYFYPTAVPELCKMYIAPDGARLHDIMLQPYYDSRVMEARDSDILILSFPKAGTTWLQEIAYLVVHDADFAEARSAPTEVRIPFLEIPVKGIEGINKLPDPRLIKSHLNYEQLPLSFRENKNVKMIYIIRNPKDTVVSLYHFIKMVGYIAYNGTFEDIVANIFDTNNTEESSYMINVLSYWNRRNDKNMLILFYEDLLKDLKSNVEKIAKFLGKHLNENQICDIADYCSFNNMKKNPMANYSHGGAVVRHPDAKTTFMRKGVAGDWKNCVTEEMNKKMDEFIKKHFEAVGLTFTYEV